MNSKSELRTRADIELLINTFYAKARKDELIGFFFDEVLAENWPAHVSAICDFWESLAFGTAVYKGDPMTVHKQLHAKHAMAHIHFERWLALFTETMDALFEGEKASELKKRAASIAQMMELKVTQN